MAKGLTDRQQEILRYVGEYIESEGYPPSIREIGDRFNIGSLRGVTVHLDALEKKGYIERNSTPRSIRITHPAYQTSPKAVMLPLLGQIAAGTPIFSEDTVEDMIPVPSEMVRTIKNAFVLRVKGDSMTGDGIKPRDLVIVRPQETAEQGDLVAIMVGDEATVKRIHFESNGLRLMPSNPAYEPIMVEPDEARVVGKVIGLIRDYEGMAF